jgi:hypothetical protein
VPRDAERYRAYHAQLATDVALLKDLLLATLPTDLTRFGDLCCWTAAFEDEALKAA